MEVPTDADDGAEVHADEALLDLPLVGTVDLQDRSLLVSTVLIGFVDGFNPCSLWVLSLLLGARAAQRVAPPDHARGRHLPAGHHCAVRHLHRRAVERPRGAVVRSVGPRRDGGCRGGLRPGQHQGPLRVAPWAESVDAFPERAKPRIYRRMRRITAQDAPLPVVLGGTTVLAIGVSVVETPCTAGLPLLWSNLLAAHEVGAVRPWGCSGLDVVFLLDQLVVLAIAVVTLRAMRLQERHGRALKLGSGVVMLALAGTLLAAPQLLLGLRGTLLVFGGAAVVTALVLLVERLRPGRRRHSGAHRDR